MDTEKRLAAEAAAELVEDGMSVGLGTGSTVAFLLEALAARGLSVTCAATSLQTERRALELGLTVVSFDGPGAPDRLDIAIDGADQITRDGWVVKGGGAAHTREKLVEACADRFVVIVSPDKLVERIGPPVPLELMRFGLAGTLRRLGPDVVLRDVPPSPDGGIIADWVGPVGDPAALAALLAATPGVVEHGLFEPALVTDVIVGRPEGVEGFRPGG
jgi:ribose 5-phosphate isomerase A